MLLHRPTCGKICLRVLFRQAHVGYGRFLTNVPLSLKQLYRHEETEYAYSVLKKLSQYQNSLATALKIKKPQELTTHSSFVISLAGSDTVLSLNGLFAMFVHESIKNELRVQCLKDKRFTQLCSEFGKVASRLKDEQLFASLHFLSTWEIDSPSERNFSAVWHALDIQCMRRLKQWDAKTSLFVADLWFTLKLNRITGYNTAMIRQLSNQIDKLTSQEVVQLLFYITLQRSCNMKTMVCLEEKLEQHVSTLTVGELAVAALSFFKTQNKIWSETLLRAIFDRLMCELETLDDFAAVSFAKLLRYSATTFLQSNADIWQTYDTLLNACIPRLNSWSSTTCTHFAFITTNILLDHETFFSAVAISLQSRLADLRLKDLARFLHSLAKFDRAPQPNSSFYTKIIEELKSKRRVEEVASYPDFLVSCLTNLSYCNVFPKELLNKTLSSNFVRSVTALRNQELRELFHLDCTLTIEVPTYRGNRLSPVLRNLLWQKYKSRIPNSNSQSITYLEELLIEVQGLFSSILGPNKAVIFATLPHYNWPDIIVHTSNQEFLPIASLQPDLSFNLPSNYGDWHCFVIGHRSCYSTNTKRLLGHAKTKVRQLQKIGYHIIEIPWYEYNTRSMAEKRRYLSALLKDF